MQSGVTSVAGSAKFLLLPPRRRSPDTTSHTARPQAHWYYEDVCRVHDTNLKTMHLKDFCQLIFKEHPLLEQHLVRETASRRHFGGRFTCAEAARLQCRPRNPAARPSQSSLEDIYTQWQAYKVRMQTHRDSARPGYRLPACPPALPPQSSRPPRSPARPPRPPSPARPLQFSIPVFGAILLTPDMDKCLMVQGMGKGAGWGFPKGKARAPSPSPRTPLPLILHTLRD